MANKNEIAKPVVHSETLKIACGQLLEMYVDEEYGNMALEMGRLLRSGDLEDLGVFNGGSLPLPCLDEPEDKPEFDIFGEPIEKKNNFTCECPRCHRTVAASIFARHLQRCMGMGRTCGRNSTPTTATTSAYTSTTTSNTNAKRPSSASHGSSKSKSKCDTPTTSEKNVECGSQYSTDEGNSPGGQA